MDIIIIQKFLALVKKKYASASVFIFTNPVGCDTMMSIFDHLRTGDSYASDKG